jgi:predicted naringenin-chalcone synthase
LCTLHFQKEPTPDNIASSLLFADGAAAVLITHDSVAHKGWQIDSFYSEILAKGKKDMAWELSSSGFLMTLSGYVPELIEEDFSPLISRAADHAGIALSAITNWCIHPGGRRILDAIIKTLQLPTDSLQKSYEVLKEYGNMSSPTILFVLKRILQQPLKKGSNKLLGAAFGPGLTMETFTLSPQ